MSKPLSSSTPMIWMNVTTSANWTRPPVGIVRVEQMLCSELEKLFGSQFKKCVWMDGSFVEWIPDQPTDKNIDERIDFILPRSASFEIARRFLARFLAASKKEKNFLKVALSPDVCRPTQPRAGDVLISVGLDWDNLYTAEFFNLSKKHGLKIITCCYDLIPVLFPQYCVGDVANRFKMYFNQLTWGSSALLCISQKTQQDYISLCKKMGSPILPTCIIPLGDSIPSDVGDVSPEIQKLSEEPFILFVSTIERRKNHEVLYRAYHLLCMAGHKKLLPKLVFVGMAGWGVSDLLKDIELDPQTSDLIVQLNHLNDAELRTLYKKSLFCVYPSLYEGWGLPVGEALALGKVVLASDQGSLPEVGGDLVCYLPPWNPQAWADAILGLVTSPADIKCMEQKISNGYAPRTWVGTAKTVKSFITSVLEKDGTNPKRTFYPGYDFSTQSGLSVGPCLKTVGQNGFLMFGPYISLAAVPYQIRIHGSFETENSAGAHVDVVLDQGNTILANQNITHATKEGLLAELSFKLDKPCSDLEIRIVGQA